MSVARDSLMLAMRKPDCGGEAAGEGQRLRAGGAVQQRQKSARGGLGARTLLFH